LKGLSLKELEDEIPRVKRGRDKKILSSKFIMMKSQQGISRGWLFKVEGITQNKKDYQVSAKP